VAVIIVVPKAKGVRTLDRTEATLGLDDVKVHEDGEVEVGYFKVSVLTLSFMIEMTPKGPTTGAMATTVNFMEVLADFQF
jgi:hypothetical protein